jgi:tRNA(Arg) A34 adenosine deaminase TadA
LKLAKQAGEEGEVPVGAVVVKDGKIVGRGKNGPVSGNDPTAHAEIQVIREGAIRLGTPVLEACDLYVTLEPCAMCTGAISLARMRRLIFGAYNPKGGGVVHGGRFFECTTCCHAPQVIGGVMEQRSGQLLRSFFDTKRQK